MSISAAVFLLSLWCKDTYKTTNEAKVCITRTRACVQELHTTEKHLFDACSDLTWFSFTSADYSGHKYEKVVDKMRSYK